MACCFTMEWRRRKAGYDVSSDEDEDELDDDAVSASAFAALCHKHGISPPSDDTFDRGMGMVQETLGTRMLGLEAEQRVSSRRLDITGGAGSGSGSGSGSGNGDGDSGSDDDSDDEEGGNSGGGGGGEDDVGVYSGYAQDGSGVWVEERAPSRSASRGGPRRGRRSSLVQRIQALERARGALNRMVMVMQGHGYVVRAVDKFKALLGSSQPQRG